MSQRSWSLFCYWQVGHTLLTNEVELFLFISLYSCCLFILWWQKEHFCASINAFDNMCFCLHFFCISFTHSFAQIQQNHLWFVILAGAHPKNIPVPTVFLSISSSLLLTQSHLLRHTRSVFLSFCWSHIPYNNERDERVRRLVYWLQRFW